MKKPTLAIIIPAYNEACVISKVIAAIPKKMTGISKITTFVIDDGSADQTGKMAQKAGAQVLTHLINQGVGAATLTGFEAAKMNEADVILTLDGDGQHDPTEINKIVNLIAKKKYDVVIGSRLLERQKMPTYKSLGNNIMNWLTYVLYGIWVKDSQSGFKGFSRKTLQKMNLSSSGYEICSEIIGEIKRLNLKYCELPIKTIYTPYSKKRGQFSLNGINIIIKLIVRAITG